MYIKNELKNIEQNKIEKREQKLWKIVDESHLYSTPKEALLKLFMNVFIMIATIYCYFQVDNIKHSVVGAATLTYVISYINEVVTHINKNANMLYKFYIACFIVWIVLVLGFSVNAVFGEGNEWKASLNDPLVTMCFIPLVIQMLDVMLHVLVPDYIEDNYISEKPVEHMLRKIEID